MAHVRVYGLRDKDYSSEQWFRGAVLRGTHKRKTSFVQVAMAGTITNRLLGFSKMVEPLVEPVYLAQALDETLGFVEKDKLDNEHRWTICILPAFRALLLPLRIANV